MIKKSLAIEVLNAALKTGADYSEIYYENTIGRILQIENNEVEVCESVIRNGVGLRILKENQCVYGYTSDLSRKGLLKLAESLASRFNEKQVVFVSNLQQIRYKNRNKVTNTYVEIPREEKVKLIKQGLKVVNEKQDSRIIRSIGIFSDSHEEVTVFNSKEKYFTRISEYGRLMYQFIARNENGFEVGFEGPGAQQDISYFTSTIIPEDVALKAYETAITMLEAKECPSGKMTVVVGSGWGGVLFHEACGHALEASSVSKDLSCFSHKVGQKVASDIVTAIDDSTIPHAWGSIDIDDEGNFGKKRVLIKNGILQGYMIDDFNGRRMNEKGNGSCRRQNYRYCPTSRMSNTYIAPGTSTKEEIIAATKLGLYAVGFNGGSVDPATGEFNFACSQAYIIRDGKIAEPVKGATLIGKGYGILKEIDMVGNDLNLGQGLCGASSGTIRTNVGQPTIRIKEVLVGGKGGELKA